MRYALIRKMDVSNGYGIGVSLFVQGCRQHCKNCFNPETWSFSGGKLWTNEAKNKLIELASAPYITRVSILGGEPLETENLNELYELIMEIRDKLPEKKIWLYTGKKIESLADDEYKIVNQCDVVVDGEYVDDLKDIRAPFYGSSNQRIISVQESLKQNKIVLYDK